MRGRLPKEDTPLCMLYVVMRNCMLLYGLSLKRKLKTKIHQMKIYPLQNIRFKISISDLHMHGELQDRFGVR